MQAARDYGGVWETDQEGDGEGSESSVSTMGRAEYLVDINDGMDMEGSMACAGYTNGQMEWDGDIELNKRKPPDGGA